MKRYDNLYNFSMEDIKFIYKLVRINTKNKEKIKRFDDYYSVNLSRVKYVLDNNLYKVGKYNVFLIKEPKYRIIMSQSIIDKLVNHLVAYKILIPIIDKSLINTNVATRKGRGTHFGIFYLKRYLNKFKGKEVYALKFDILKFFYNIDHDVLIKLLKNKIKDKKALDILVNIINSTDGDYINECIKNIKINKLSKLKDKKSIDEIKNIPYYKKGKGLPIGNMTSQILAIYYLNELDHFIKEKLKCKFYIRYMDDGIILSSDKEYLKYCLNEIIKLLDRYKLRLNNKTKIVDVNKEGVDFLGFRFYIKDKVILRVRNSTKKRFKRKIKNCDSIVFKRYVSHLKWGNCYNLINSVINVNK